MAICGIWCSREAPVASVEECSSIAAPGRVGLPATGKSTLSKSIAREFGAVHLRFDAIEQGRGLFRHKRTPATCRNPDYEGVRTSFAGLGGDRDS